MPRIKPSRPVMAILPAFIIAFLLATLAVILLPVDQGSGCPFWTSPLQISSSLEPGAPFHIECMDSAGDLHVYRNVNLYEWTTCFALTFIVLVPFLWFRQGRRPGEPDKPVV